MTETDLCWKRPGKFSQSGCEQELKPRPGHMLKKRRHADGLVRLLAVSGRDLLGVVDVALVHPPSCPAIESQCEEKALHGIKNPLGKRRAPWKILN
ncbi:hypothetical protein EK904_001189 [Melospiza melodia maxima]|nr:hypothetical protein EK904_001189 [Melospiza melodia maxima]